MKKLELKVRNGEFCTLSKTFDNDDFVEFVGDYYHWGLGIDVQVCDAHRYLNIHVLCFHLWVWF